MGERSDHIKHTGKPVHGILLLIYFLFTGSVQAQDPFFSQFFTSRMYLNPGFAGATESINGSVSYRSQWSPSDNRYETIYAAYDQPSELLHGGVGVYMMNDRISNIINRFNATLIYAYHLQVTRKFFIQAGFQVALNQRKLAHDQLIFPDMIDPSSGILLPTQEVLGGDQKVYMDYSVGFVGFSGEWYGGLAVHHLATPRQSDSNAEGSELPRKFTVHLARNFNISGASDRDEGWWVTPEIMVQNQGTFYYFKYGAHITHNPVFIGVQSRHDLQLQFASLIFSFGYLNKTVGFTYSYDVSMSKVQGFTPANGAHEVSVLIKFPYGKNKRKTIDAINLPLH